MTGTSHVKIVDTRTGLEVLDREQCLELLRSDVIGRLAVIAGGAPVLVPVNYAVDGSSVVIRTDEGTKLAAAGRARAAFEIDRFDRASRSGWSVVVTGDLVEVTHLDEPTLERVRHLDVDPWAGGAKQHWLRLVPATISGRRIT